MTDIKPVPCPVCGRPPMFSHTGNFVRCKGEEYTEDPYGDVVHNISIFRGEDVQDGSAIREWNRRFGKGGE